MARPVSLLANGRPRLILSLLGAAAFGSVAMSWNGQTVDDVIRAAVVRRAATGFPAFAALVAVARTAVMPKPWVAPEAT